MYRFANLDNKSEEETFDSDCHLLASFYSLCLMNGLVAASITLRSPAASKGRRQSTRGPGKARAFSTSVRTLKDDVSP